MGRWLSGMEPWGRTLLRLVLGCAMIFHGWHKAMPAHGWHSDWLSGARHFSGYVAGMGLPAWLGYVSVATELFGGVLLVLGLLTRFAAVFVAINMVVAIVGVDLHRGYEATEYALALLAMAVMLVFGGGGAASVDQRLGLG